MCSGLPASFSPTLSPAAAPTGHHHISCLWKWPCHRSATERERARIRAERGNQWQKERQKKGLVVASTPPCCSTKLASSYSSRCILAVPCQSTPSCDGLSGSQAAGQPGSLAVSGSQAAAHLAAGVVLVSSCSVGLAAWGSSLSSSSPSTIRASSRSRSRSDADESRRHCAVLPAVRPTTTRMYIVH